MLTIEDSVRIPPKSFGEPLEEVALKQLRAKYDGIVSEKFGYVIAVTDIKISSIGKILPGDGGTYHRVTLNLLSFYPKIQEIVEGNVIEIADFGAFIRIGPIDALIHVSQLMDDYISYDEKQGILMGKETKRSIKTGDFIRGRITAVSFDQGGSFGKIGLTARQPFLGKLEFIKEDVEKLKKPTKNKEKKD